MTPTRDSPPADAAVDAPAASVPSKRPTRWGSRALAIASVVLLGAGALHVARWLRERRELADSVGTTPRGNAAAEPRPAEGYDPRMEAFMSAAVRYGRVREMPFGKDRALFAAGPSSAGPERVFAEILGRFAPSTDEASVRREIARGPSAIAALRTQVTVGTFPGGSFLVRLSPLAAGLLGEDGAPLGAGPFDRLHTEPGGVVLAFDYGHGRFEYVLFYFPAGLDVEAFTRKSAPRPEVLATLGPEASDALSFEWSLGGDGDMTTTLCRAKGPAGAAMDRVALALGRRGFRDLSNSPAGSPRESDELVRVLEGPRSTIWLTTSEGGVDGGLVTVTMTAL